MSVDVVAELDARDELRWTIDSIRSSDWLPFQMLQAFQTGLQVTPALFEKCFFLVDPDISCQENGREVEETM